MKEGIKVGSMSVGSYPRIGDTEKLQRLRRAWAKREVGEISEEEYKKVEDEFVELAIREQERAGIDIVTDGMIRWYDQISHFARVVPGIKINGLLRFFDTNTYFRQPILEEYKPEFEPKPVLLEEFRFAKKVAKKTVKPVITGPVTLAKLSKGDFKKLLEIYTRLVENEVRTLSEEGAQIIQIDEPACEGKDVKEVEKYLERVYEAKGEGTRIMLFFYFKDFSRDWKKLMNLPADIIGFDFTYSSLEDAIASSPKSIKKPLVLGVFDGRNTRIEKETEVERRVRKILKVYPFDEIWISPSCGLEYLPRRWAQMKLKAVAKFVKYLSKKLSGKRRR